MTRYQVDSEAVLSATAAVQGSIGRIQAEVAGLHGQLATVDAGYHHHAQQLHGHQLLELLQHIQPGAVG